MALVPRVLQIEKIGEYDYNHSSYHDIKGAIFNVYFEHPFSKVVFPVNMSEEEIQGICTYDPWYTIHYKNLQEETPINRAQDTYISNCRQKQKAREERTRIEKEQAYIGAVVLGMIGIKWKKKTKRNGSKNRLDCGPEKKARD